jgi:EmrB/QacA subfamily drug resistance transporter
MIGTVAAVGGNRRWTLVAVCVTTFMLLVDITIVVVALPSIQRHFSAGLTNLQWVVDAYALTLAALILTAGALADRFGRRLIFLGGVVLFTASSAVCGAAWSIGALDIARAVQGIGGAMLFATALALIGHEYRGPERFQALAIWGATVGAAVASGPLLGGILTDALSWRWIFFVNIPIGAFALVIGRRYCAESKDERAVRTDVLGLASFSAALFLIVFGILRGNAHGWSSGLILGVLVAGGVTLVAFVVIEALQERPMLDINLFRQRAFLGVSLATLLIATGMFAMFPYISIFLQDVTGTTPLGAGLRFLPITAFVFLVPLATRRVAARVPLRATIGVGLALIALGLGLMGSMLHTQSSWHVLLPGFIVAGLGIGLANPALAAGALRVVDPERSGMASGISNTFRLAGVALGVAVFGAVLESRIAGSLSSAGIHGLAGAVSSSGLRAVAGHAALVHPARVAFVGGFDHVLLVGCGIVFAGAVAAATLLQVRRPEVEAVPPLPNASLAMPNRAETDEVSPARQSLSRTDP